MRKHSVIAERQKEMKLLHNLCAKSQEVSDLLLHGRLVVISVCLLDCYSKEIYWLRCNMQRADIHEIDDDCRLVLWSQVGW